MSAFHSFNESFSQFLPEMENFANRIEQPPVIPQSYYPPQYGFGGYNNTQHQQPSDSYHTYQNYNSYQYNQYSSHQPYPFMYYPPPLVQQPTPITIVIPKSDQRVIKLEINMGVGGQNSVIKIIQEAEPENLSLQAITELLEPSDYSSYYDNGQRSVYAEMNDVNSREMLAIEGNPILQTLETPKFVKEVHQSSTAKNRLSMKKRKIQYTCSFCNHDVYSKSALTIHLKTHKRPFCSICHTVFDDEESININCCRDHKIYKSTRKITEKPKNDLKFILKTTAPITDTGETQKNWELVPKPVEVKEIEEIVEPQPLKLKEKENIGGKQSRDKKKLKKKSVIVPETIETTTVMSTSRFGRSRVAKKFS